MKAHQKAHLRKIEKRVLPFLGGIRERPRSYDMALPLQLLHISGSILSVMRGFPVVQLAFHRSFQPFSTISNHRND
jgi:hypothetical protein